MQINIGKWGNSLAVRIPSGIAKETNIKDGSEVEILVRNKAIIIKPRNYTLDDLVERITEENFHEEISSGKEAGKEKIAW